jgi:hypothetical protein
LNVLSPWSPNGPVPNVRVIAPFLSFDGYSRREQRQARIFKPL